MRSSRSLSLLFATLAVGCAAGNNGGDDVDAARAPDARTGGGAPDAGRPIDAAETFDPVDAGAADAAPGCAMRSWVNLLVNADLDSGPTVGWSDYSARGVDVITTDAPLTPFSAPYVAWLAGYPDGYEQLWQTVTIPPTTTMLRFRGRGCFVTDEPTFGAFDLSTIRLYEPASPTVIETLVEVTNDDAGGTCDFALIEAAAAAPYAGRRVDLVLEGMNDTDFPTSFWWDSLALEAYSCR